MVYSLYKATNPIRICLFSSHIYKYILHPLLSLLKLKKHSIYIWPFMEVVLQCSFRIELGSLFIRCFFNLSVGTLPFPVNSFLRKLRCFKLVGTECSHTEVRLFCVSVSIHEVLKIFQRSQSPV